MSISNCGHDENGKYKGGKSGDQTGGEWRIINWYNRPWNCVLRHPNESVRKMIAVLARKAAENNLVGYDQNQRTTYWEHLKASNYDPAKITVACEADCSSGVAANVKAVGHILNITKLKNVSINMYTGNMKQCLKEAGFEVLTDSKYLTSDKFLLEGDIILNERAHVATNLTNGTGSGTSSNSTGKCLSKGSKGPEVKEMQKALIKAGYSCGSFGADGDFGSGTEKAVRAFQKDAGLLVDGIYGPKTKAALKKKNTPKKKKVDPAQSFDKNLAGTYKVTASALNLRAGANTSKNIIETMPKGTKVQCYGYYTETKGVKWLYIAHGNATGYASSKYLEK